MMPACRHITYVLKKDCLLKGIIIVAHQALATVYKIEVVSAEDLIDDPTHRCGGYGIFRVFENGGDLGAKRRLKRREK
jgi:hypothetical protein